MQEIFDLWLVININKQSNRCKSDERKALDKSQQTQERIKNDRKRQKSQK